jgi:hypothetical protein
MRKAVVIVLLAAFARGPARAATVYLKEGGRLEGTVVSSTEKAVELETSQGRVSIAADRVLRVDDSPAASVVRSRPALAEKPLFDPPQQNLSFAFGLAAPLNDVDFSPIGGGTANNGDVGPAIGLQYLYLATPRTGWGLEFDYYGRGETDSPGLVPSANAHVFGDTLLILGVVKHSLIESGSVRPYLLLGAGAHRTSTTVDARPFDGFAWSDTGTDEPRRLIDASATGFAASARLGLDFGFADPGVFSLEAGWTMLASAEYGATPQGRALGLSGVRGPLNYFTFMGRWGWSF